MPVQNYPLQDGSTLEVTTTEKEIVSTKLVETKTPYTETTSRIISGPDPIPNKLPLVAAGIDQQIKLPVSEVSLTGAVSDSDGTIKNVAWTKLAGPVCNMLTPGVISTKVTGMVVGDYMFRLSATDDKGGVAADDLNVKVLAADPVGPDPVPGKYLSLPISGKIVATNNQVIENLQFKNIDGNAIRVGNCQNVIIRNCFFNGSSEEAIEVENGNNVTITNCLFARCTTGVYALSSSTIKVNNCQFVNVRMRLINGNEAGRGQFVQFNGVNGPGNEIMNNKGENFQGESNPEDMISLYNSSGTAASPIKISGNMSRGGGPSASGGGYIAGDNGGGYVVIENNVLLNPGNYGLAIAGGHDIIIRNNKIFSKRFAWSNNPLYMWGQSGAACSNNQIHGNALNWTDKNGNQNRGWNAANCGNSVYNPGENKDITEADLNVPVHLIDFITQAELLTIRK